MHPLPQKTQTVSRALIDEILSRVCRIPQETVKSDDIRQLKDLGKHLSSQVFGQDEAVAQIVNAVKFSRAGLLEAEKPLASLLFVGPTGVGKTEIVKCLAKELGIRLLRFDMSEYEEKHAVAKLIGAPAGYVGYEEGGILTEEIRKNPHCILLLDEIEKAHPDIYNILLQVMDYATLTDNQGRKADFRNVILIMTSNAGASQVGKSLIGFGWIKLGNRKTETGVFPERKEKGEKKIMSIIAVMLFAILAAAILVGQGVKSWVKDRVQEPRPFVVWLEKTHHIPVDEFYTLKRKDRGNLVKEQLAEQQDIPT